MAISLKTMDPSVRGALFVLVMISAFLLIANFAGWMGAVTVVRPESGIRISPIQITPKPVNITPKPIGNDDPNPCNDIDGEAYDACYGADGALGGCCNPDTEYCDEATGSCLVDDGWFWDDCDYFTESACKDSSGNINDCCSRGETCIPNPNNDGSMMCAPNRCTGADNACNGPNGELAACCKSMEQRCENYGEEDAHCEPSDECADDETLCIKNAQSVCCGAGKQCVEANNEPRCV